MLISKVYKLLLICINSVYLNFKCFDFFTAIRFPIIVGHNVKILGLRRNSIILPNEKKFGEIKLGFNGTNFIPFSKSLIEIKNNGRIIFENNIVIAEGFNVYVNAGTLKIGKNFYSNRNLLIQCENKIIIGDDCLFGWNVQLRDTNGSHSVFKNNIKTDSVGTICLGNHIWITSDCLILDNSFIANDNIIATKSVVKNIKSDKNCLIAGIPAAVKKGEYTWKK